MMNSGFLRSSVVSWFVLATLFLHGCGTVPMLPGDVVEVHPGTARFIVEQAKVVLVDPGGRLFLYGKPFMDGWGFVIMDAAAKRAFEISSWNIGKGNFTDGATFSSLVRFLKDHGWLAPSASTLARVAQSAVSVAEGLTTFVVLPMGVFSLPVEVLQ